MTTANSKYFSGAAGINPPPQITVDPNLKPGDVVYIGDHTVSIGVLQGPPGPAGPPGVLTYEPLTDKWVVSDEDLAIPATSRTPELSFDVDGWRFSFASVEIARRVREKLMSMTLEGEL
jgi:hypothetical protein